jgi:hypothetical protein
MIDKLEILIALANTKHFGRAAEVITAIPTSIQPPPPLFEPRL